jgi:hypothetical protein
MSVSCEVKEEEEEGEGEEEEGNVGGPGRSFNPHALLIG